MDPNRDHRALDTGRSVRRRSNDVEDEAPVQFDDPFAEDTMVDEEDNDVYDACGLITRERELDELGVPDKRSVCFGCVFVGERETTAIPYNDIMDIIEMGRAAIGVSDPVSLAKEMARRYAQVRRECNSSLMEGERPLPRWKASTILVHIQSHTQDPEIGQWVQLRNIQELKDVALQAAVMKHRGTKRLRVDEKQAKVYADLVRLEWFVRKQDAQKSCFYSGGGHIDPKSMRQGIVATSGKPIVALWNNASNKSQTYR